MRKNIRVLMIVANLRVSNGVVSYAMNYYRKINHDTVTMDFCLLDDVPTPYYEEIKKYGSKVFVLPSIKYTWSHLRKCREILENGNYDIIHDNSLLLTFPMMKMATKYVPVRILHSHNSKLGETAKKEKRNKFFLPFLLRQANAYASCSDLAAKAMFGDAVYEFIPNFVDVEKYHFDESVRQRVRHDMNAGDKKIIATVGRVAAQKNPFFALDVFDIVAEREREAEYWWIGSGPLDNEVADYANKLKHKDRVKLLGSRNDMKDLYQAIDLFFLPSLFEGLPVTGVEAQAMGLPCVISDSVTKEVVYTDLVEYVSLSKSKEAWAKIVCSKLDRNEGRRGREEELLKSKFSSGTAGEFLEDYYRKLIQTKN